MGIAQVAGVFPRKHFVRLVRYQVSKNTSPGNPARAIHLRSMTPDGPLQGMSRSFALIPGACPTIITRCPASPRKIGCAVVRKPASTQRVHARSVS